MEKSVLITGASKGIGKALAEEYAKHGYSLLLLARTTAELERLQQDLQARYHIQVKILTVDLAQANCVEVIMDAFKDDLSELDILINNAGFGFLSEFGAMAEEDVTEMVAVNIIALTKLTHAILPFMLAKKRGKILNLSSLAGFIIGPYMAEYYATKAFILSFSQALSEEYKKDGIIVSALCPGVTESEFGKRAQANGIAGAAKGRVSIMTAEEVAQIAYAGLEKNKRVIIPGFRNQLSVGIASLLPSLWVAKIVKRFQSKRGK